MRTFSLWVFDRRERLLDELATEVSVFWTVDGVSLKARLDFLKPRCVVVRRPEGTTFSNVNIAARKDEGMLT